ncbi:type III secretion system inner membrane ring lipoprotein SctJ [Roseomonas sp. CCTCC AB2023176]|uniref:type III secretion system inner membrane ring lipoprotein SctJ n=1 Tax=Roseomonas sp. CCTCC AB2023176 TaxID=3342640 RepID=UPI0035DBCE03
MTRLARLALLLIPLLLAGCKVELNRGLSEREANEIVALLLRSGIPAERGTTVAAAGPGNAGASRNSTVLIPEARFAESVDILRDAGLPRQQFSNIGEVFRGEGLVSSPTEERARYVWAMGQELSRTVSEIDGVLAARVHLVLPENDPLRRESTPGSASVFIRHAPGAAVANLVPQIKEMVANALPGLTYDRVAVTLVPAATTVAVADAAGRQPAALVQVLGLWVHADSAPLVRTLIGIAAAVVAALLGLVGWLFYARRRPDPASVPSPSLGRDLPRELPRDGGRDLTRATAPRALPR